MPDCTICGVRFKGRGFHCGLHYQNRPSTRSYGRYNYSSDSTDPSSVWFSAAGSRCRRHRTLRFADQQEYHDSHNALVRSNTNRNAHQPLLLSSALAQPLIQVFSALTDTHAIASVRYSVNPSTGTHSLTAEANFDREQCAVCQAWFPDHEKLLHHQMEFQVGCEECYVCLRLEDTLWHAKAVRHERCFVRGCGSVYRKEGGWKAAVVERHVWERHR